MNKVALQVKELGTDLRRVYFDIKTLVDQSDGSLPRIPEIVKSIDNALNDDNMTVESIADIIRIDPTIAGRIIQIANSPLVRGAQRIDSLKVAIGRIGLNLVRNLIFCMGMQETFERPNSRFAKQLKDNWLHSIDVMSLSFTLSKRFPAINSDTAMVIGIIHDIGALPIYNYCQQHDIDEEQTNLLVKQLHVLLGVDIAEKWDLSDIFKEAIIAHHSIGMTLAGPVSYSNVVTLADIYAAHTTDEQCNDDEAIHQLRKKMGFNEDTLGAYLEETAKEIDELKRSVLG